MKTSVSAEQQLDRCFQRQHGLQHYPQPCERRPFQPQCRSQWLHWRLCDVQSQEMVECERGQVMDLEGRRRSSWQTQASWVEAYHCVLAVAAAVSRLRSWALAFGVARIEMGDLRLWTMPVSNRSSSICAAERKQMMAFQALLT